MVKVLWIAAVLALVGCTDDSTPKIDFNPTAIDFGDSVSLEYWRTAHKDLADAVDFTHDEDRSNSAQNDGCMKTMLEAMHVTLDKSLYTVIIFNSGVHDIQATISIHGCGDAGLDNYRAYAEKAAELAGEHADFVVIADTISIRAGDLRGVPAGAEIPYNQILHQVAREHGFYSWSPIWTGRSVPGNVHLNSEGAKIMGQSLADCILTVLNGRETDDCHP